LLKPLDAPFQRHLFGTLVSEVTFKLELAVGDAQQVPPDQRILIALIDRGAMHRPGWWGGNVYDAELETLVPSIEPFAEYCSNSGIFRYLSERRKPCAIVLEHSDFVTVIMLGVDAIEDADKLLRLSLRTLTARLLH
jgi:hypothetical protein